MFIKPEKKAKNVLVALTANLAGIKTKTAVAVRNIKKIKLKKEVRHIKALLP